MSLRWQAWALPVAVVLVFLGVWQAAVSLSGTPVFPGPLEVARGLRQLVSHGLLVRYVVASLFRVSVGFMLALAVGIPLGLVMGWFTRAYLALNPLIQILRPISPIAWIPIAILWFGIADAGPIFLIFLASVFPICTAATAAVRTIPTVYIRAARNFGVGGLALFRRVILPAALPQIVTGIRLALGVAWLVVVAAEMFGTTSGLGYLIIDARNAGRRYDLVVAGMVLIGVIGLLLDLAVRRLERLDEVRWGIATNG